MIKFKNVSINYGKRTIVNNINLNIDEGKITGIIGPNGCGKSSLVKCLMKMNNSYSGNITIKQTNIKELSIKELSSIIGYVGQETNNIFDFTVRDIVEMGLFSTTYPKKHLEQLIDKELSSVDAQHLKMKSYSLLSGGEKKIVLLARAIVANKDILVLDEPTNHLDIKHQIQILDYLKKTKKTILLVIHDLNLAARYCDKIYLVNNAHLIDSGSPLTVLNNKNINDTFNVYGSIKVNDEKDPYIIVKQKETNLD